MKMNEEALIKIAIILPAIFTAAIVSTCGIGAVDELQFAQAGTLAGVTLPDRKAPPAITADNIYVSWWTNKSGNDEVMFRASNDSGQTFGDKINLSNTTDADSNRVEIDSDADSVVVTWWETNDTSDVPVMRVSNDNGKTFGPLLKLAGNGTIASPLYRN